MSAERLRDGDLLFFCTIGNFKEVKRLVADGADVNAYNSSAGTPLCNAAKHGYVEIARFLLDHGAKIDLKHEGLMIQSIYFLKKTF